ncbi:N-acetylglucosaminyl-diphospho-decaprenol L-rhamnosyltransferase [Ensifer sp. M14]|uniref:glycosyltransferase n=1 Tax=Ensifer sp. M14 TaxID=2203782 RepID=UPI000E1DE58E|nr:glycosyltransferase [Ensifer sp. M14]RDL47460.1 N-acetylglucosaminyl-diphospho-decaprenol L-rhamnosyltransferase [Ensifer sp. M14]
MKDYTEEDIELLRQSVLFDADWYRNHYKDVNILDISPEEHYLWIGSRLNRDPSPLFNTKAYITAHSDVRKVRINPLIHFIKWGQSEGRLPLPETDTVHLIRGNFQSRQKWPNVLLCAHEVHAHLFGGERSFLDVLDQISQFEINIFVTIPKNANPHYVSVLRRKCVSIFRFHYPLWHEGMSTRDETLSNMKSIMTDHNIDIIYANTIFLRDFQKIAKSLGVKSICHVRELIENDDHLKQRIGLEAEKIVADLWERSDILIANSRITQRAFSLIRQPVYAPNVVDGDQFDLPNPIREAISFGIVSSNTPKKGISDFIEIAHACVNLAPRARFSIIGPRNAFIEDLERRGLPPNLVLRGYAETPQAALQDVNVVMSLSHFAESFGRTVAEAQAARRPVIAYAWGAVPELVDDRVTGFLVPHLDTAAAAHAVKLICETPSLVEKMGNAGRSKMLREFAPCILRDALHKVLSEAAGQKILLRPVAATKRVTVVIPVYNGYDAVRRCLESVKLWTSTEIADVLVINDGSSDPAISPLLFSFEETGRIRIVENEKNLGYTSTINRAIKLCAPNDVILLNSDTLATPRWVEGLHETVYGANDVGTATAMGDNSGAFSFPTANRPNPKPEHASHALWAATLVRAAEKCPPVEVPTGNGFCIYIRRKLFDQIGLFDETLFPRGYGEENDFCMRAKDAGWRNLISPRSYIFHERTVSFGAEKTKLIEHANDVLRKHHPSYFGEVKTAFSSDGMESLRKAVGRIAHLATTASCDRGQSGSVTSKLLCLNEQLINWGELIHAAPHRNSELVSIVVCVYNNPELTEKCVRSLMTHTVSNQIEIILVDNGSTSETISVLNDLEQEFSEVRAIFNYENLNFSLGNNIGFASSSGSKVVFLNNDTQVTSNWLGPLLEPLEHDSIKGAQPRLLYPDGTIQCVGVVFSGRSPLGYPIYSGKPNLDKYAGKKRTFKAVTAACLAMRASDFANARGFDPNFLNGQEDIDLCLRLGQGAASFVYVPNSVVYHFEGKSQGRGRHILHNRTELLARWNKRVAGDDTNYYQEDGFRPDEYEADIPQFVEQGIACWRPKALIEV